MLSDSDVSGAGPYFDKHSCNQTCKTFALKLLTQPILEHGPALGGSRGPGRSELAAFVIHDYHDLHPIN